MSTFGEWLKEKRNTNGLSQVKLAKKIGIDKGYLSQVEAGLRPPSEGLLKALAEYFSINEDEIRYVAGKIPEDIAKILRDNPIKAPELLRTQFRKKKDEI